MEGNTNRNLVTIALVAASGIVILAAIFLVAQQAISTPPFGEPGTSRRFSEQRRAAPAQPQPGTGTPATPAAPQKPRPPTLTRLDFSESPSGVSLGITGSAFHPQRNIVNWDEAATGGRGTASDGTSLQFTVPEAPVCTTHDVSVTTPHGTSNALPLKIVDPTPPLPFFLGVRRADGGWPASGAPPPSGPIGTEVEAAISFVFSDLPRAPQAIETYVHFNKQRGPEDPAVMGFLMTPATAVSGYPGAGEQGTAPLRFTIPETVRRCPSSLFDVCKGDERVDSLEPGTYYLMTYHVFRFQCNEAAMFSADVPGLHQFTITPNE